jgi:AraC-like DNA-binding protein/ketosteroid isomerase-like protein
MIKALIENYFTAWNNHDIETIVEFFAEDGIYIDNTLKQELNREQLMDYLSKVFVLSPDIHFEITSLIVQGDTGMVEWKEVSAPFDKTQEKHEPLLGAEVIRFHGDKIVSVHHYYIYRSSEETKKIWSPDYSVEEAQLSLQAIQKGKEKYQKSRLAADEIGDIKKELLTLMEQHNVYLEEDVTLANLASRMNVSTNHLSQVINSEFKLNFFDFMNSYRVEAAKALMQNPKHKEDSIVTIAEASGFQSTSAFYTAFKKRTGMTPSDYKNPQGI